MPARSHGHSYGHPGRHSREYAAWQAMIYRCTNPASREWENYGGRGITVCERWRRFPAFLEDIGMRPSPKHSIDRIDNDGNYEPGNCRWATLAEQLRNRRNTVKVSANGQTLMLKEWAERLNADPQTLYFRLRRGWEPAKAVTTPPLWNRAKGKAGRPKEKKR